MNWESCQDLLVSLGIRSSVFAFLIWLAVRCLRGQSANVRCVALSLGMLGLALLPLSLCLPRVELAWLPSWSGSATSSAELSVPVSAVAESGSSWWSPWVVVWFVGILAIAFWQSLGLWRLDGWRRRGRALDSGYWQALIEEVCSSLNYRGRPQLYAFPSLGSPAAAGVWRPCVFLPQEASTWSTERLRVVLLHEIGHLKRRDLWTQWLSQLVCTLYWFHPMVWWLNRTLHQEREYACDHTVLSSGTEPSLYARHLLALAESFSRRPQPRLALTHGLFLAMAAPETTSPSVLERRVRSILSFRGTSQVPFVFGFALMSFAVGAVWATATLSPITPDSAEWPVFPETETAWSDSEVRVRLLAEPFAGS